MLTLPSHPDVGDGVDDIIDTMAEFYAAAAGAT
jgi:hypothetical protein